MRCCAALLLTMALVIPGLALAEPVTFSALGCGPYTPEEMPLLEGYMKQESADGASRFILYLGDLCRGSHDIDEAYYARVAEIFKVSTVPVFVVPGDNEWNDRADPDLAWRRWLKHYLAFDRHWPNAPVPERQPERPENMAWTSDGVLFVGINLVGGHMGDPVAWHARHRENAEWVKTQFEQATDTYAAVVFCQAMPNAKHHSFIAPFRAAAAAYGKPVLFLHADGHYWLDDRPWPEANIRRIMVDNLGAAPPVRITVSQDAPEPFSVDRQE